MNAKLSVAVRPLPALMLLLISLASPVNAATVPSDLNTELRTLQEDWAHANYELSGEQRKAAFDKLIVQSAALTRRYPQRAEALIWDGIVLSTAAGVKGGLGALSLAKQARAKLEAALAIDPQALEGSAYTSLGTLYHKVPGFPIGFGSDKKATEYLQKALAQNPEGIDANYFYGELMFDNGNYESAIRYLQKALQAPPRPGRALADEGRRQEIEKLLARVRASVPDGNLAAEAQR